MDITEPLLISTRVVADLTANKTILATLDSRKALHRFVCQNIVKAN